MSKNRVGRPRGRNYEVISSAVDPALRDPFIELVESTGGTISSALRPVIEEFMKRTLQEGRLVFEESSNIADQINVFKAEANNEGTKK